MRSLCGAARCCAAQVSEGLDFSDKAGRGVVITGIPFAMRYDAKVGPRGLPRPCTASVSTHVAY